MVIAPITYRPQFACHFMKSHKPIPSHTKNIVTNIPSIKSSKTYTFRHKIATNIKLQKKLAPKYTRF